MCGLCKSCCSVETRVSAMKSDDSRCNLIILNGAMLSHQMHIIFCMSALRFSFASKWLDKRATARRDETAITAHSTLLQYPFIVLYNTAPGFLDRTAERRKVGIRHREKEESLLTFRQNTGHSIREDINAKAQRVIQSPRLNLKSAAARKVGKPEWVRNLKPLRELSISENRAMIGLKVSKQQDIPAFICGFLDDLTASMTWPMNALAGVWNYL